jgi:LmbE family N-acetylglucosaminyl deacetylase
MGQILHKIRTNRKYQLLILSIIIAIGVLAYSYFKANPVMPQMAIYFLDDVRLPEEGQTVLIFSPHQDDETIACGGYIIESIKKGAEVIIVLVTDGNRRSLQERRCEEFETATGILGVPRENLVYLDYPDSRLAQQNQQELQEILSAQIEKYKPDILFYPHPEDNHKDHSTIGIVVEKIMHEMMEMIEDMEQLEGLEVLIKEEALKEIEEAAEIAEKITIYKYLVHHVNYPHPKTYAPDLFILPPLDLVTLEGGWERLMLEENTKRLKEKALRSYKSQLRNPLLKNLLESSIRENEIFAVEVIFES